ncbi:MAG TPA: hypothetical protein VNM39_00960, partial [Verrucomicrobiae bacterium]|nr:hypothetical protein [Verrucomicrobiae bacterium]
MRNLSPAFALPLRASAFAGALLALATSLPAPAGASTVNLRWNDCWGDGGAANRSFACNTNSGSQLLVGSFISPFAVPGVVRHDVLVEVALNAASVPAWWMFRNAGTCRQYSLTVRATPPVTAVQCIHWARTFTLGAILTYVTIDP